MSQAGNEKKQASELEAPPPAADQELGKESLEQVIGGGIGITNDQHANHGGFNPVCVKTFAEGRPPELDREGGETSRWGKKALGLNNYGTC